MSQVSKLIHPIAQGGFDKLDSSKIYEQYRPRYSKEVVHFLLDKLGIATFGSSPNQPIRILELGAGTGKFTGTLQEVLRDSKMKIIASEPLLSMREEFGKRHPDIAIKDFPAENIDLPNSTMHAVIAAQSFHWFANEKSISEIHRVLVPGGKLGLVWNRRDHSVPWLRELDEEVVFPLYQQSNTPYQQSGEWEKVLSASDKFGPISNDESFKMDQTFNFDEFVNRIMSISVVSVQSKEDRQRTIDRIKLILSKHNKQDTDTFTVSYLVQIYWCQRT